MSIYAVLSKMGVIALFPDTIPNGKNIKIIKKQVKGGRIYIKLFLKSKPAQLNHYILLTLEKYSYSKFIIHIWINDTLRSKDSNDSNDLQGNVIKIEKIFQNNNIGKIITSGIIPSTGTNVGISNIKTISKL